MDFGIAIFPTLRTPSPGELARLTEAYGFESLWFPDHTHIPAARETPFPTGGDLPPEYARIHDPFVGLAAAAAVTERIKICTGVCLVVERDPIVTAKQVATLDHLSSGRVVFGVGAGWNREEMANHGTDPSTRMKLMRERVEAIKRIWTEDEASYEGELVRFDRIWCWPKPLQRPHPPIVLGGREGKILDRVLAYADGWMPNIPDDDQRLGQVAELRERADRPIPVSLFAVPSDPRRLARYVDAGIERGIFYLPQGDRSETERRLEAASALVAQL